MEIIGHFTCESTPNTPNQRYECRLGIPRVVFGGSDLRIATDAALSRESEFPPTDKYV